MFRLHDEHSPRVEILLDGERVLVPARVSVAAALLWLDGAGDYRRHVVDAAPRAPYCMMGVCHDCLISVDGRPNRQGCLVLVAAGMRVERQRNAQGAAERAPAHGGPAHG